MDEDRISQCVYFGSVHVALAKLFITPRELLLWLGETDPTHDTKIAYRVLCDYLSIWGQFLQNGQHLLSRKPCYFGICLQLFHESEIAKLPIRIPGDSEYEKYYYGDISDISAAIIAAKIRSENFMPDFSISPEISVPADWFDRIPYSSESLHHLSLRFVELSENAPLYWDEVAQPEYRKLLDFFKFDPNVFSACSKNILLTVNKFFPNTIDSNVLEYDGIELAILLMNNVFSGYLLGFPIHIGIPTQNQVKAALSYLKQVGPEKYVDEVKEFNIKSRIECPITFGKIEKKEGNDETVLMESPLDYSPFDLIEWNNGSVWFRFTRPEFESISKKQMCPWTNELISLPVLTEISRREALARTYGLPDSCPISKFIGAIHTNDTRILSSPKLVVTSENLSQIFNGLFNNP